MQEPRGSLVNFGFSLLGCWAGCLVWVCCFQSLLNEATQTFLVPAEEPLLLFPVGFGWGCPQGLLCHMAEASDILGESVTPTAVTCAGISSCPSGSEKSQFQPEKVSLPISKIGLQGPTQTFQPKPALGVCDSMKFGFLHFFSGVF